MVDFIKKINKFIKNPNARFSFLNSKGFYNWMSDENFLKKAFKIKMGARELNLDNPKTFNEKLQWLKLYNRKPEYTIMVDKFEAKYYIASKIGEKYTVPTLGVWNDFDDIDFAKLPDKFVLKCTHDSGGLIICKDKSNLDKIKAKKTICHSLKSNYYKEWREWPYRDVKPRIIAEPYLLDDATKGEEQECLTDYKIFCFNGNPKIIYISKDKSENPTTDFFDMDFKHLPIRMKDPNSNHLPKVPDKFEEMKKIAKILSEGIPCLRVDFYCANGRLYVGELTFYHCGGFASIEPIEWSNIMGDWIELPKTK